LHRAWILDHLMELQRLITIRSDLLARLIQMGVIKPNDADLYSDKNCRTSDEVTQSFLMMLTTKPRHYLMRFMGAIKQIQPIVGDKIQRLWDDYCPFTKVHGSIYMENHVEEEAASTDAPPEVRTWLEVKRQAMMHDNTCIGHYTARPQSPRYTARPQSPTPPPQYTARPRPQSSTPPPYIGHDPPPTYEEAVGNPSRLFTNFKALVDCLTYNFISPTLISKEVVTLDEHDDIESRPTRARKVEALLTLLQRKVERGQLRADYVKSVLRLAMKDQCLTHAYEYL
jgi:hypothetical protein